MCTVEKMLIKGIRSFSPDNQTVIEFFKPLTLIVGANGAGKTTVIECLKQACTGELPPNTRSGQSFIHDPKIAHETEVKALIKLRFTTSTGTPVVVLRSFQLTQKKTNMQFKTLDSTLQTINKETNAKEAVTYRCADIDKMVPSLMGVSKAVLENVIFVHQEESNWPLAEGRVLKDKFDDIFSATKYTKALEALRKLRSEKQAEVKLMRVQLETLKSHRDQALKLKKDIADGQGRAVAFEEQMRDLETQIQMKQEAMHAADQRINAIIEVCQGYDALQARHDMLVRQTQDNLNKLKEGDMEETDAELEDWVSKFDSQCRDSKFELDEIARKINNARIEKESMNDKYQRDCLAHGRMAAEAAAHTTNCSELQRFMGHCAAVLGLPAPAPPAGGAIVPAAVTFKQDVEGKRRLLEAQLKDVKTQSRAKDANASEQIDRISQAMSRTTESMRLKREQITKNERTMQALETESSLLMVNMTLVNDAHERVAECEARLRSKQAEVSRSGVEEVVAQERMAIQEIQGRISALRQERERLAFASDSSMKLRIKRQELAGKEEALAAFLTRWRPKLLMLLRTSELPSEGRLKDEADKALVARRSELVAKGKELTDAQAAQAAAQGALGSARSQLFQAEAQLSSLKSQVRQGMQQALEGVIEEGAFEVKVQEVKKDCESLGDRVANARGMLTVMQVQQRDIRDGDACPTCRRRFQSNEEKQQVLALITEDLEMLPSRLAFHIAELERHRQQMEALQALQPQWLKMTDLAVEVPALRERMQSQEARLQELTDRVAELQEEYAAMDHEVQESSKVMTEAAWQVDRLWRDVQDIRRQVGSAENSIGSQAVGSGRTVADVDQELEREEEERTSHERARDDAMRKQTRLKDDLLAISADVGNAKAECARVAENFLKRNEMEAKLKQLTQDNAELTQAVEALQAQQQPQAAQREALVREREATRQQATQSETEAETKLREVQQLQDQLQTKLRPVEEYVAKGRAQDLQRANDALAQLKRHMDDNQQLIQDLEKDKTSRQEQHSEMDSIRRDAMEVLEFRRSRAAAEQAARQLKEMKEQVAQLGDRAALSRQHEALTGERDGLRRRQDMLRGQVAAIRQALQSSTRELEAPQYQMIEAKFNEARIRLKTLEYANEDLDKYHKALEKALLMYHTGKMSDINKIIKELWQKTYRGQDIDYIQVKADAEGTGARSYNYRVVMYSGGAELEMRGRCSAGQKVLACLIIRLALAETFCLNCGILALDEPTTNLDADNSESLADALKSIMMARRDQQNFQLIVITHDENFANKIGTRDNTDYMWRITKDEKQHTKVEAEAVAS